MSRRTRYRAGVRPSQTASAAAAVVGIGMACFGLFFLSIVSHPPAPPVGFPDFPGQTTFKPMQDFAVIFVTFWLVLVVGGVVYHLRNALDENAPPTTIIEYESAPASPANQNVANQLRELEQLKIERLISEAEYEQKRNSILDKLG